MHKRVKYIVIVALIILCGYGMVQFKAHHSAKEVLREEGIRYYRMAKYGDAADCFSLALKQQESFSGDVDKDIYFYLADGEMKQENYTTAITYYEKLLELSENGVDLYANLGICYEQQEKYNQAYTYFNKAAKCKDASSEVFYQLAEICLLVNRQEEAKKAATSGYAILKKQISKPVQKVLETGVLENPSKGQLNELTKCAQLSYLSGDYDSAYSYYKILKETGNETADLYMGHCLAEAGKYEEALAMLLAYEKAHGEQMLSTAKIAYCYMQQGKYEEALPLIDKALTGNETALVQELLYEKGIALEHTGDFDGAFDCFADYISRYPEDEQGKREYDFLVTRISDEKAASAGVDNGN